MARLVDTSGVVRFEGTIENGGGVFVQDADPGAVGAGALWLNTTDPGHGVPGEQRPLLVRNAANTDWLDVQTIYRDDNGVVRGINTISDGLNVWGIFDAAGVFRGEFYASADGQVTMTARDALAAGLGSLTISETGVRIDCNKLGMFGAAPVVQQVLAKPAGDAGNLWDVLNAYGLVVAP